MCTSSESQIKVVLGKRIYEVLKYEYLEQLRSYIKTHKSIDLSEINLTTSISSATRIGNVLVDRQVLEVTRKYLNMNGIDFESVYGDDGQIYFNLTSIIEEHKKTLK